MTLGAFTKVAAKKTRKIGISYLVIGHWSLVIGDLLFSPCSLGIGHWSLVICYSPPAPWSPASPTGVAGGVDISRSN